MRAFRRGVLALSLAVLIGSAVRLMSSKSTPPHSGGGWRELEAPDFR